MIEWTKRSLRGQGHDRGSFTYEDQISLMIPQLHSCFFPLNSDQNQRAFLGQDLRVALRSSPYPRGASRIDMFIAVILQTSVLQNRENDKGSVFLQKVRWRPYEQESNFVYSNHHFFMCLLHDSLTIFNPTSWYHTNDHDFDPKKHSATISNSPEKPKKTRIWLSRKDLQVHRHNLLFWSSNVLDKPVFLLLLHSHVSDFSLFGQLRGAFLFLISSEPFSAYLL